MGDRGPIFRESSWARTRRFEIDPTATVTVPVTLTHHDDNLNLNDSANQWTHQLTVGQALVFDNWRMLHGRTAFSGNRKMTGAYTNREDLESRIRLLTNC